MKRKLISALSIVMILAMISSSCGKSEETKKRKVIKKTENTEDTEEEDEDGETDPFEETGPDQDRGTDGDLSAGNNQSMELDPDRILFTYEYSNAAWGQQSSINVILGDGRIYTFSRNMTLFFFDSNTDYDADKALINTVRLLTKLEPMGRIDQTYLEDMYLAASQVDPDSPITRTQVMYDAGQTTLYYWDENGNKVCCISDGDYKYTINDPHIPDVEYLWEHRYKYVETLADYKKFDIFPSTCMPIQTMNCGYVVLPNGSSGKYVFSNYEAFLKAAEEWHIEEPDFGIDDMTPYQDMPVFVQFDIFPSLGYQRSYDAMVMEDDMYFFLPSDDCCDPDPNQPAPQAMDGFVTVAIYPSMTLDPDLDVLLTSDGTAWEKYVCETDS